MANKKKFNVVSIVILAVLGVALIMGIVGLCINWIGAEGEYAKLQELIDVNKDTKKIADAFHSEYTAPYPGAEAVQAFGIIAVIAAALTAVSFVVSKFVDIKALKFVTIGLAVLLIVSALLALILSFATVPSELKKMDVNLVPAAGCWLLSIFGIVGGAAGVYGGLKG